MPLRDVAALEEWAERADPPISVWRIVNDWVDGLGSSPWQAPSVPFPELSDQPRYELRTAEILGTDGVEVVYRREYDGEMVDLVWVGRLGENRP